MFAMIKNASNSKVQIELVRQLFNQCRLTIWTEPLASIGLTAALWKDESHSLLLVWLAFNLVFCDGMRFLLIRSFTKANARQDLNYGRAMFWLRLMTLSVAMSGICWGTAGSVLMLKNDLVRQSFLVILLMGVTAAANPIFSAYRPAYTIFVLLALLPFSGWLLAQGGIYVILGGLALVYIVLMLATSSYACNLLYSSLLLCVQNNSLVENLSRTMIALESRKHDLEKSLSLVKATLESTTDGILVINTDNRIEDYNRKFVTMWSLPEELLKNCDFSSFRNYVKDMLIDPSALSDSQDETTESESFKEILLKDGSVFECYSRPQLIGSEMVGRVWSFRDVSGRKYMEARLFHQANFDSLTGLPSRGLALDRICQSIAYADRFKKKIAIMFVDLDQFKIINDTLGHAFGDELLKGVASRLRQCVRQDDTVSREGGDEFLAVLTSLDNEEEAAAIARKCLEALSEPFLINENKITTSLSIGISFFPRDGVDAETLIRNADIAMYQAKEMGRNNCQIFTEEMNRKALGRLNMETQLRNAMANNEFVLFYQPIINLKTGHINGMETMLRWNSPKLGMVFSGDFIPVAEESGVIIQIADWMLRKVCTQIRVWEEMGLDSFQIAVNLYSRQLRQADFYDNISQIIQEAQIDPHRLAFQIKENMISDDLKTSLQVFNKLKKLGVRMMIDGFGIGYSSMGYMKQLPIDQIKIDRSFVKNILISNEDAAITAAIIALAGKLNMKVIAEGVENRQQIDFLASHQCDAVQGFYYSEPLDVASCTELLATTTLAQPS